jgi:hypothetical protein
MLGIERLVSKAHRESLALYAHAVLRHWFWVMFAGVLAVVGVLQEVLTSVALPWWVWLVLSFVAFSVAQYQAFHDLRLERDDARGRVARKEALTDALLIEPEPTQQWGGRADYVQHILVTNRGPAAKFRAQVTSPISGLDKEYGKGMRVLWEQTNADEIELGEGELGRLRFASFERNDAGPHVTFYAIPTTRHATGEGYLPTQRYAVSGNELLFDLCLRNIEDDVTYERHARVVFSGESRPHLSLWEA